MSVEDEIKNLERKLLLKKAYMNVSFTFGKGYKSYPADVRQEVVETLKQCASKLAAGEKTSTEDLTEEEVTILKGFAQHLLSKKNSSNKVKAEVKVPEPKLQQPEYAKSNEALSNKEKAIGSKASLLMLDSLPLEQRKLVEPNSEVTILSHRLDKFFVEDPKKNRFWVPAEDLELLTN